MILLSAVTVADLNFWSLLACTTMPVLAVSIAPPVFSDTSILKESDGSRVLGFWKLSQVISKVVFKVNAEGEKSSSLNDGLH